MSDNAAEHLDAAARHEMAAQNHDRAAGFWDGRGDGARAQLQREMADYERHGAVLERRWADLVDPAGSQARSHVAELAVRDARRTARQLAAMLTQTAATLERAAELAEAHAERREQAGKPEDAAQERRAAEQTRELSRRARSQAEKWLDVGERPRRRTGP